jgi:hypothetical protein
MSRNTGLVCSEGHRAVLDALIATGLTFHLYTNEKTPEHSDDWSQYIEPRLIGYAPVPLNAAQWTIQDGTPAIARYPDVEFKFLSPPQEPPVEIFGSFIISGGRRLYAVSPLATPFAVLNVGDALLLAPTLVQGMAPIAPVLPKPGPP